MRNADYQAARRDSRRKAGVCHECGVRAPMEDCKRCRECIDKSSARRDRLGRHGPRTLQYAPFCLECIASGGFHRVGCVMRKEVA